VSGSGGHSRTETNKGHGLDQLHDDNVSPRRLRSIDSRAQVRQRQSPQAIVQLASRFKENTERRRPHSVQISTTLIDERTGCRALRYADAFLPLTFSLRIRPRCYDCADWRAFTPRSFGGTPCELV
jgi:hypothetical protein